MAISLKMTPTPNEGQSTLIIVLQFIKDSLPMLGGIIAVWKTIDEVAKWYSRRQEAKLKELIKSEVYPEIQLLRESIDALREEIGRLKGKL